MATKKTTTTHSAKYAHLLAQYKKNYITVATLRKWVVINEKKSGAGITAEEFKEITGEDY